MQPDFWHERWATSQIGFHESQVNPQLVAHFEALALAKAARVFVPLCGKTLDIDWLLSHGYRVAGAELSAIAVAQVFQRLGTPPKIDRVAGMQRQSAAGLDIFVGDIFSLSADALGPVDGVYDRAALIALPPPMRRRYAAHLDTLTRGAPQLLVTLEYDQHCMEGPPFSVPGDEVRELYGNRAPMQRASREIPGGLKGKCPAVERVWLLSHAQSRRNSISSAAAVVGE